MRAGGSLDGGLGLTFIPAPPSFISSFSSPPPGLAQFVSGGRYVTNSLQSIVARVVFSEEGFAKRMFFLLRIPSQFP